MSSGLQLGRLKNFDLGLRNSLSFNDRRPCVKARDEHHAFDNLCRKACVKALDEVILDDGQNQFVFRNSASNPAADAYIFDDIRHESFCVRQNPKRLSLLLLRLPLCKRGPVTSAFRCRPGEVQGINGAHHSKKNTPVGSKAVCLLSQYVRFPASCVASRPAASGQLSDYDVLYDEPVYSMETSGLNIRDPRVAAAAAEFNNWRPDRTEAKCSGSQRAALSGARAWLAYLAPKPI